MTSQAKLTTTLPEWASDLYACIDGGDFAGMFQRYSPDIRVRFGNAEPTVGQDALKAGGGLASVVRSMAHHFIQVWEDGNSSVLVAEVDYTLHDGTIIQIPAVTVIRRGADGLIDDMQIVVDTTPLFS